MGGKTGRFAILEQFLADDIHYMFGNPGTSEEGFLDALWDYPDLRYVLTLQESVAVMIADGYARATQKPALVQLHSTPGLGNGIGALYQAMRGHSPLVVIGGDAGVKYQPMDAQMAGDLVAFAEPVTKWSTMVVDPASLLRVIRRAIKVAMTPPTGPVYVCLPMDILDAPVTEEIRPTSILSTRVLPDEALLRTAAQTLANAHTPMIVVGDGIARSGAQDELTCVAECLGAEVWEADSGEFNMSHAHPLYQGTTGHMFGSHSAPLLAKGDVNLVCGTYLLPEVFPELGSIFAPNAKIIHIDLDTDAIAKNHPVNLGMLGDPKVSLAALAQLLDEVMTDEQKQGAIARRDALAARKTAEHAYQLEADRAIREDVPLHFSRFAEELAKQLPDDAIIFDEALTCSPQFTRYYPPSRPGHYFLTRGGSLGVGIPGAIGAQLAYPNKTVVGITGDGGSMYTIQALWTAARHHINAKFIICNNRSYRLLQLNVAEYWKAQGVAPHDFPLSFDLSQPVLRFDEMARSMGVPGLRVEKPDEIAPAIQAAFAHNGPFLLDVVLEGDVRPDLVSDRCG